MFMQMIPLFEYLLSVSSKFPLKEDKNENMGSN